MNEFPRNHSAQLGFVANKSGVPSKLESKELLDKIEFHHAGDLVELTVNQDIQLDLSTYRTYRLTLTNNSVVSLVGLARGKYAYIVVDPNEFNCTFSGLVKEATETTKAYNVTLYKLFSYKINKIDLVEVTRNMYGIKDGEFTHSEFTGNEFNI